MNPVSVHTDGRDKYAMYRDGSMIWLDPTEVEPTLISCKQKKPLPMPAPKKEKKAKKK